MSLLLDHLPSIVWIGSRAVKVNTDFRYCILFEQLCLDRTISPDAKAERILRLMFPDAETLPLDEPQQVFDALLGFYRGGERPLNQRQIIERKRAEQRQNGDADTPEEHKVYDYECDDELIYAAFLQQYGIDLVDTKYLHWWKFRALFSALTEQTKFMQVIGYRTAKITSSMSAAEKARLRKLKDLYALPIPMDEVEKTEAISSALRSGNAAAIMRMIEEEYDQGT